MLNIGIIEDVAMVRLMLERYLNDQQDTQCVLASSCIEDFLLAPVGLEDVPCIVLCDIDLPGRSGIEGISLLKRRFPLTEVVMLSVHIDSARVFKALCEGASGYLEKGTPLPMLKRYLFETMQGGSPMSPSVARHVVRYLQSPSSKSSVLTSREQEVVDFIEQGMEYEQIANRLEVRVEAIRRTLRSIYHKLQIHTSAEIMDLKRQRNAAADEEGATYIK